MTGGEQPKARRQRFLEANKMAMGEPVPRCKGIRVNLGFQQESGRYLLPVSISDGTSGAAATLACLKTEIKPGQYGG